MIPRPFNGRYGAMLTVAIFALAPFIVVTTAFALFSKQIGADASIDSTGLEIINGLATAGYAFGALLGGDVINRFPQRQLFLICESIFIVGSLLAATAGGAIAFGSGSILQGFATGLMLVVALPPVIRRFPAGKMPITSAAVNIGFFGATTAGPLVGGAVAMAHVWRWFYGGLAGIGVLVFLLAVLSLPDQEPQNRSMKFDSHAIAFGLGATFLSFYAAGALVGNGFASFRFTIPLGIGFVCFVALILTQYHKEEPLSPVKPMWNTFPITGTIIAMIGGGAFITFLELALRFALQVQHQTPLAAGLAFWPQVAGAIISAVLLGALIRTRYLPVLILAGMLCLVAAGVVLMQMGGPHSQAVVMSAAGLMGLGAGGTVAPALWLAGFALPSKMVGRTFALVELVRSVADFILAPVILEVAHVASASTAPTPHGLAEAAWYTVLVTIAATALCAVLYLLSGAGLPTPDLDKWLSQNQPALHSPSIGAALRKA
ncbi:MAG TPA: MFS transporter [Terriglobales bacterium]|nr:MFS transporter [Terriglobales bacterium]